MELFVSPRQVARAIGVSESSLKRWCDDGLIPVERTAGGHRRIPISGVVAYLRSAGRTPVAPELLGLPATSGQTPRVILRSRRELRDALLIGDATLCRQIVFDQWLSGQSLPVIFDQVIAAAFTEIGEKWSCREADVYQERRACEVMLRVLHEIRQGLPAGDSAWPAIGGTLEGDYYTLPTTMAELVLQAGGWSARSLGSSIPFASLATAIRADRPRLVWVSVSFIADPERFRSEFPRVNEAADEVGAALAIGGFALDPQTRRDLRCTAFCESMENLVSLGETLRRVSR